MGSWVTQLRKGLLEFCVLNVLSTGESYGYQLVRRLETLQELAITESTVYPILNRLRKDGYVKVRAVASSTGPPRRYFSLSALGNRRIREMDAYWGDLCASIDSLRKKNWGKEKP